MPTVTSTGFAKHNVSLAANVETIVNLAGDFSQVEVIVWSATAAIYFTVDGTPAAVNSDNAYALLSGANIARVRVPGAVGNTQVRLRTSGTATVSVTGTS